VANEERSFSTLVERMLREVDYLMQLCKRMTIYNETSNASAASELSQSAEQATTHREPPQARCDQL
jgi:predicted ABC-type ATPase